MKQNPPSNQSSSQENISEKSNGEYDQFIALSKTTPGGIIVAHNVHLGELKPTPEDFRFNEIKLSPKSEEFIRVHAEMLARIYDGVQLQALYQKPFKKRRNLDPVTKRILHPRTEQRLTVMFESLKILSELQKTEPLVILPKERKPEPLLTRTAKLYNAKRIFIEKKILCELDSGDQNQALSLLGEGLAYGQLSELAKQLLKIERLLQDNKIPKAYLSLLRARQEIRKHSNLHDHYHELEKSIESARVRIRVIYRELQDNLSQESL